MHIFPSLLFHSYPWFRGIMVFRKRKEGGLTMFALGHGAGFDRRRIFKHCLSNPGK